MPRTWALIAVLLLTASATIAAPAPAAASGVPATPALRLAASADLAMAINWTHTAFFASGRQFGLAGEYAVDRKLMLGLHTKFGPQFITLCGTGAQLAFTVQAVVGYRM